MGNEDYSVNPISRRDFKNDVELTEQFSNYKEYKNDYMAQALKENSAFTVEQEFFQERYDTKLADKETALFDYDSAKSNFKLSQNNENGAFSAMNTALNKYGEDSTQYSEAFQTHNTYAKSETSNKASWKSSLFALNNANQSLHNASVWNILSQHQS